MQLFAVSMIKVTYVVRNLELARRSQLAGETCFLRETDANWTVSARDRLAQAAEAPNRMAGQIGNASLPLIDRLLNENDDAIREWGLEGVGVT
ncbi:MAG: hypothetical protein LQ338_004595 [Usnochroma carphineum]|nr:MAG: hypothetical protein LQ338_004595 [Usnochroma carphineum]